MIEDELLHMKKQIVPSDELIRDTIGKIEATKAERERSLSRMRPVAAALCCCVLLIAGLVAMPFFKEQAEDGEDPKIVYFDVDAPYYNDFESLLSACELAVLGTVTDSAEKINETAVDEYGTLPMAALTTEYSIRVEEVIFGDCAEESLSVTVPGAEYEGNIYRIRGCELYEAGGQYVIFLNETDDGYREVSPYQGKVRIENDVCVFGEYTAMRELLTVGSESVSLEMLKGNIRQYDVMDDGGGDIVIEPALWRMLCDEPYAIIEIHEVTDEYLYHDSYVGINYLKATCDVIYKNDVHLFTGVGVDEITVYISEESITDINEGMTVLSLMKRLNYNGESYYALSVNESGEAEYLEFNDSELIINDEDLEKASFNAIAELNSEVAATKELSARDNAPLYSRLYPKETIGNGSTVDEVIGFFESVKAADDSLDDANQ